MKRNLCNILCYSNKEEMKLFPNEKTVKELSEQSLLLFNNTELSKAAVHNIIDWLHVRHLFHWPIYVRQFFSSGRIITRITRCYKILLILITHTRNQYGVKVWRKAISIWGRCRFILAREGCYPVCRIRSNLNRIHK